jgi:hypothetical protein
MRGDKRRGKNERVLRVGERKVEEGDKAIQLHCEREAAAVTLIASSKIGELGVAVHAWRRFLDQLQRASE